MGTMTAMNVFTRRDADGNLHSLEGPALVDNDEGVAMWFFHGSLHSTRGPAVVTADGRKEFWYHGVQMDEDSWDAMLSQEPQEEAEDPYAALPYATW